MSVGDSEKYLDSGYIVMIEPTELSNRLTMECERKEGIKEDFKLLIQATGRIRLSYTEMEKNEGEIGLREEVKSLLLCYVLNTCYPFKQSYFLYIGYLNLEFWGKMWVGNIYYSIISLIYKANMHFCHAFLIF